jgi:hypothetical protein
MALGNLKLPKNRFTSLEMAMPNSPLFKGIQLALQIVQNRNKTNVPAVVQEPSSNS